MSSPIGANFAIPLPGGTFGAARVIDNDGGVTFLVLEGFWSGVPTADEVAACALHPLAFGRRDPLRRDNVWKGWFEGDLPDEFPIVTRSQLTARERGMGYDGTMVFQGPHHFADMLHEQWRWIFDRENLKSEWKRSSMDEEERQGKRRDGLTLESMREESPFASWEARCGGEVLGRVRRIFRDATEDLIAAGGIEDQELCAAVLKKVVDALNDLDDPIGFIESTERDALVQRVEELASLVGLDNGDERLTGHRDW